MDAIVAFLKLVAAFFLTVILNKFLSIFRSRQLYISYDSILDCHDQSNSGYTAKLKIYNKGKEKEKNIEINFPSTTSVQVLSADYQEIKAENNKILIDRILPAKSINVFIYLSGTEKLSEKLKPSIKSEDADGSAYYGAMVPTSTGSAFLTLSFFIIFFGFFGYSLMTDKSFGYFYYSLRYPSFTSDGLMPAPLTDNRLISSIPFSKEEYPISVLDARKKDNSIITGVQIKNILASEIYVYLSRQTIHERLTEISEATRIEDKEKSKIAVELVHEKYGTNPYDSDIKTMRIAPGQTKVIELVTAILPNTKLDEIKFILSIDGQDEESNKFRDMYYLIPSKLANSGSYRDLFNQIKNNYK